MIKYTWHNIINRLSRFKNSYKLKILKSMIESPKGIGARKSIGWPAGQDIDYRLTLANGGCLHVREFEKYYEAHIDRVDPRTNVIEHFRRDMPCGWVMALGGIGLILGREIGRRNRNVVAGALIGLISGVIFGLATKGE